MTLPELPKVSVLLPTRNLRHLLPLALDGYAAQDYPASHRELVVVDSGPNPCDDLLDGDEFPGTVTYIHLKGDPNCSRKRNLGIGLASGNIILHMDSDDWSAPARISDQVAMLTSQPAPQLVAYSSCFWWDMVTATARHYRGGPWGATMAYWREYAESSPWDESCDVAEDAKFITRARDSHQLAVADGDSQIVCLLHRDNARRQFPVAAASSLPAGFIAAMQRLQLAPRPTSGAQSPAAAQL